MAIHFGKDPFVAAQVIDLIMQERHKALSAREWKHRIAGYGYSIKDTDHGQMVATLPHGVEICSLPAELAH